MHINALKMFCDVIETGSFTKSSHLNGVGQAGVSAAVRSLEGALNVRLAERTSRKIQITPKGQIFYDHARQILETYAGLVMKLRSVQDRRASIVRVAAIEAR